MKQRKISNFYIQLIASLLLAMSLFILSQSSLFYEQKVKPKLFLSFPFISFRQTYEQVFGSAIPFLYSNKDNEKNVSRLIRDEPFLVGTVIRKGQKGFWIDLVDHHPLISSENGFILFVGYVQPFGKTIVIQQENGREMWLGHFEEINVPMYGFIHKGEPIGKVKDTLLYVAFKEEGEWIPPEKVLPFE